MRIETRHSYLETLTSTPTGSCSPASIFVWLYNLGQLHVESCQHLDVETQMVCELLVIVNHPTHLAARKKCYCIESVQQLQDIHANYILITDTDNLVHTVCQYSAVTDLVTAS